MAEVSNKVLIREIFEPTQRMTFTKAAQNDIVTFVDSVHYVETSPENITITIPGIEHVCIEVGGKLESWEYVANTMSANQVSASGDKRTVVVSASDIDKFEVGVFHRNEMTGEYFQVIGKDVATNTLSLLRGVYGTVPEDFSEDDVITQFNKIKLTSSNVGSGTLICTTMPTPGYAQSYAKNV